MVHLADLTGRIIDIKLLDARSDRPVHSSALAIALEARYRSTWRADKWGGSDKVIYGDFKW